MEIKRFILQLIHGLISLTSFLFSSIRKISKSDVFGGPPGGKPTINDTILGGVKRVPVHIGLIFVEDLSYTDVANIILWCASIGISYITVYDPNGELKRQYKLLDNLIRKRNGEISKSSFDIRIHKGCIDASLLFKPSHCMRLVDVVLLSWHDSTDPLVQKTRQISRSVVTKSSRLEDITPSYVDHVLQVLYWTSTRNVTPTELVHNSDNSVSKYYLFNGILLSSFVESHDSYPLLDRSKRTVTYNADFTHYEYHGFPDPDLVIKFGSVASLLGYLPWQIRLSEIISVSSHHHITYSHFIDALRTTLRLYQ